MEPASTASIDRRPAIAAAVLLAAGVFLAIQRPITLPEAYAYSRFVWPQWRDLLASFDPSAHVLSILLMRRAVALFRLSAFSLRLPELAGLALTLWAVRRSVIRMVLAGTSYLVLEWLAPGTALGLGLGFWLCGLRLGIEYLATDQPVRLRNLNLAGVCLGLSIAANFAYLVPSLAGAAALGFPACRRLRISPWVWMERLLATMIVTAFLFLVLPFSHADAGQLVHLMEPPAIRMGAPPVELAAIAAILERETQGGEVTIAAPAGLIPVLYFYQARDRQAGWRVLALPDRADYSVVDIPAASGGKQVLYRGSRLLLVH